VTGNGNITASTEGDRMSQTRDVFIKSNKQ